MKITFREFHQALAQDGCPEEEIRRLYKAVKAMDKESRGWVVRWFCTGEYPEREVEKVTAEHLVNVCGYRPIYALVLLDWLKTEPEAAKYFAMKIPVTLSPSEAIGPEVARLLEREGHEAWDAPEEHEDLGDISE